MDHTEPSTDVQDDGPSKKPPAKKHRVKPMRDVQLILQELKQDIGSVACQCAEELIWLEKICLKHIRINSWSPTFQHP